MNFALLDQTTAVRIKVLMLVEKAESLPANINVIEEMLIDEERSELIIEFSSQDQANAWLLNEYEADEFDVEDLLFNVSCKPAQDEKRKLLAVSDAFNKGRN